MHITLIHKVQQRGINFNYIVSFHFEFLKHGSDDSRGTDLQCSVQVNIKLREAYTVGMLVTKLSSTKTRQRQRHDRENQQSVLALLTYF